MSLLIDALKKAEKAKQEAAQGEEPEAFGFDSTLEETPELDPNVDADTLLDQQHPVATSPDQPLQDGFSDHESTNTLELEASSSRAPSIPLLDTQTEPAPASTLEMEPVQRAIDPHQTSATTKVHSDQDSVEHQAPSTEPPHAAQAANEQHFTAPAMPRNTDAAHAKPSADAIRAAVIKPYQPGMRKQKMQMLGAAVLGLALLIVGGGYYFVTALNNIGGSQSYVTNPTPVTPMAQAPVIETIQAEVEIKPQQTTVEPSPPTSAPEISSKPVKLPKSKTTVVKPRALPQSKPPVQVPAQVKPELNIVRKQTEDPISALLNKAYQAYLNSEYTLAVTHYRSVLAREADNRDALLGLAIISHRNQQTDAARQFYQQLLRLDPKDSQAIAGLMALQDAAAPVLDESRLKLMIDQEPAAAHLHFALGNQYVSQNRWAEAQQTFFRAYHFQPNNADYAFNLAVSLDQLGQASAALQYYRIAARLQQGGNSGFRSTDVTKRIDVLSQTLNQGQQP